eukprot:scaffold31588_cov64-Phaeocystis_antarctica.AAC.4
MFALLQHEASQAREASDGRAGASGAGRGFEACGVTGRSSPACSLPCNTRHRRHARRQMKERTPVGQVAGSRPVASPGAREASDRGAGASGAGRGFEACGVTRRSSPACWLACNTRHRRHARRQMKEPAPAQGTGRGFEACGVTGRPSPACSLPCHTRHRRHAGRQMKESAPVGQGAGLRPMASHGVHLLHVREPATRDIAGTRGVR